MSAPARLNAQTCITVGMWHSVLVSVPGQLRRDAKNCSNTGHAARRSGRRFCVRPLDRIGNRSGLLYGFGKWAPVAGYFSSESRDHPEYLHFLILNSGQFSAARWYRLTFEGRPRPPA